MFNVLGGGTLIVPLGSKVYYELYVDTAGGLASTSDLYLGWYSSESDITVSGDEYASNTLETNLMRHTGVVVKGNSRITWSGGTNDAAQAYYAGGQTFRCAVYNPSGGSVKLWYGIGNPWHGGATEAQVAALTNQTQALDSVSSGATSFYLHPCVAWKTSSGLDTCIIRCRTLASEWVWGAPTGFAGPGVYARNWDTTTDRGSNVASGSYNEVITMDSSLGSGQAARIKNVFKIAVKL